MMKTFNFTLQSGKDEGCANINNPDKWGIITSHSSNDHLSSLATLFSSLPKTAKKMGHRRILYFFLGEGGD